MQQQIKQTWQFSQSPEQVWEYLTKPELIEQWLMKNNFKPLKGHKFQFTFSPKPDSEYHGVVECEVLHIVPFSKLSYSWNGRTTGKSRNYQSVVEWTLVPKKDGTELQLIHDGFTVLQDILTHTSGWNNCLVKMEELIKKIQK